MPFFIAIVLFGAAIGNMSYEQSKQNPDAPHWWQSKGAFAQQG